MHQGLTYYEATFWVGANAVIRKAALDDIAVTSYRGDWEIREFVRDRTVIEDTESTLDLGIHGWKLFNYPERLSYSATPPDFGTLTIQRRRWANGGLLILPKLRRQRRAARESGYRVRFGEVFLRWNYMASVCTSSVSLLVLLAFPFNATLINPLLGAVALPYFVAMASDLRYCGYRRRDVARIYGLNLILVPVNLAGTVSSLTQAITASKSAFVRTPKVRDRTVTPAFFLVAPYALLALAGYTLFVAYRNDFLENMGYASLNVVLAFYAIVAFIGLRHSLADAWVHFKSLLYKRERPQRRRFSPMRKRPAAPAPPHWQEVLQVGPAYTRRWSNPGGVGLVGQGGGRWQLTGRVAAPFDGSLSTSEAANVMESGSPTATLSLLSNPEPITFRTVFQPIVDLKTDHVVGFEALARFDDGLSPDQWLARAQLTGAGTALEGALARSAIEAAARLPKGGIVALKASLDLLSEDSKLLDALRDLNRPVLIEVSLPSAADAATALLVSSSLPSNVRLALEHVDLDPQSFSVVSSLRAAVTKLRLGLVAEIRTDRVRQQQVRSMVDILEEFGGELLVAGIETTADRNLMRRLGARFGQGFLLGRPQDFDDA